MDSFNFPDDLPIQETQFDMLDRKYFADMVKDIVISENQRINAIALLGGWGEGKTTILHFVKEAIENNYKGQGKMPLVVWFDAWKFENEENLCLALLNEIQIELNKDDDQNISKIIANLKKDGFIAFTAIGKLLTKGIIDAKDLIEYEKIYNDLTFRYQSTINSMEPQFIKLVEKIYDKHSNLVIIIDDLDRCLPENVLNFVERLKLFFFVPRCKYIFGIDPKAISRAIQQKYPFLNDEDGLEYLNKIMNIMLPLPEVKAESYNKYLAKINQDYKLGIGNGDLAILGQCITDARLHNARKIKKAINTFKTIKWLKDQGMVLDRLKGLSDIKKVSFCLWKEFWPREFKHLLDNREEYGVIGQLVSNIKGRKIFEVIQTDVRNRLNEPLPVSEKTIAILRNEPLMYLLLTAAIRDARELTDLVRACVVSEKK